VVGAGVSGLTAARCLQRVGYDVRVFEKAASFEACLERDRGLGIWPNAQRVLGFLGLAPELEHAARFVPSAAYRDKTGLWLSRGNTNDPLYNRRVAALRQSHLLSMLKEDNLHPHTLEVEYGREVSFLEGAAVPGAPGNVPMKLEFRDGYAVEGDFLIAADGMFSTVRRIIAPGSRRGFIHYHGYRSISGILENFYDSEDAVVDPPYETLHAGKRFAVIPLPGRAVFWFASFPEPPRGGHYIRNPSMWGTCDDDFYRSLRDEYQGFHQPIPQIIDKHLGEKLPIWSNFHFEDWNFKYQKGRIALIGDAAHTVTPNLAQGASLGIEDAWECAMCLSKLTAPDNLKMLQKKQFPMITADQQAEVGQRLGASGGGKEDDFDLEAHHRLLEELQAAVTPSTREKMQKIMQQHGVTPERASLLSGEEAALHQLESSADGVSDVSSSESALTPTAAPSDGLSEQLSQPPTDPDSVIAESAGPNMIYRAPRWFAKSMTDIPAPDDLRAQEEIRRRTVWKPGVRFSHIMSVDWRYTKPRIQADGSAGGSGKMPLPFRRSEGRLSLKGRKVSVPVGTGDHTRAQIIISKSYRNATAIPVWMDKTSKIIMKSGRHKKTEYRYLTVENCLLEFNEMRRQRIFRHSRMTMITKLISHMPFIPGWETIRNSIFLATPAALNSWLFDWFLHFSLGGKYLRPTLPPSHYIDLPDLFAEESRLISDTSSGAQDTSHAGAR